MKIVLWYPHAGLCTEVAAGKPCKKKFDYNDQGKILQVLNCINIFKEL